MISKRNGRLLAAVICFSLLTVACGDDSSGPTAPSAPTLTGNWAGSFMGNLVSGEGQMMLTQEGTNVTGEWSAPMPAALVAQGAPAGTNLAGPVSGSVDGTTATLTLGFLEAFVVFLGNPDCGLAVDVTSFSETSLEGSYTTNDMCQPPIEDQGTLTFMRQ